MKRVISVLTKSAIWKKLISISMVLALAVPGIPFMSVLNTKAASLSGQPVPTTINSYLKMDFQNDPGAATNSGSLSTNNNAYFYPSFSKLSYTFLAGDCLEYDVYMNSDYEFDSYNVNNPVNPMGTSDSGFGSVEVYLSGNVQLPNEFNTGDYNTPATTTTLKSTFNFRDNQSMVDQNGLSTHPKADLYQYDHKKWYHRKFVIPSGYVGKATTAWGLGAEARNFAADEVWVANVVITNNNVVTKEIATDNTMLGSTPAVNPYDTTIPLVNGTTALNTANKAKAINSIAYANWAVRNNGAVFKDGSLDLSIVDTSSNPMNANIVNYSSRQTSTVNDFIELQQAVSANLAVYQPFADTSSFNSNNGYVFASGDKIEYDVYQDSTGDGTGGIDVSFKEGSQMSAVADATYVDQNGISGQPNSNLSLNIPGKARWYHRVITVPSTAVNKTAAKWAICDDTTNLGWATTGVQGTSTITERVANVVVTNNGTQKLNVFTSKATDYITCTTNNTTFANTIANGFISCTGSTIRTGQAMKIGPKTLTTPITFYRENAAHKVFISNVPNGSIFPSEVLNAIRVGKSGGPTANEVIGLNADNSRLVTDGKDLDVTITPNTGYGIKNLTYTVNGSPVTLTKAQLTDTTAKRVKMSAVTPTTTSFTAGVVNSKSYTLQNITADTTVTASYGAINAVAVSAGTGGTATGAASYVDGDTVTVTATPQAGYKFANWSFTSGDNSGAVTFDNPNAATASFIMPANAVAVTANFVPSVISTVTFNDYHIKNNLMTNITPGFTIRDFMPGVTMTGDTGLTFKDALSNTLFNVTDAIGTGTTVKVYIDGSLSATYTLVMYGDVNGDGQVDLTDLVQIRDQIIKGNVITGTNLTAGDFYGETNITLNDLVGIMAAVSGTSSINQNHLAY